MAVAATPVVTPGDAVSVETIGSIWTAFFTLVFSGSYATGGDALDFLALWPGGAVPTKVLLVDIAGGAGNQLEYDAVNKKVKVFSAANTELAAGAYNAALTGDANIVAQVFAK